MATRHYAAWFASAGIGKTGLTVTIDVYKLSDAIQVVTGAAATEIGGGWYRYTMTIVAGEVYVWTMKTADVTVDQMEVSGGDDVTTFADGVLRRGMAGVEDDADALSLTALVLAAFKSSITDSTWTIRKSTGNTFAARTVTSEADAEPITGVT